MDIKIKIGNRIKFLRTNRKLTQEQLAELTGIDRSYLSDVERGKRNIAIINLEKISKALNVDISELFNFKDGEK